MSEGWSSPFAGSLEDRERFYRTLVEQTRDFITVVSSDGTILFKNRANDHPAGYSEAELVGRNVFDFIHPDDLARVREAFDLALGGKAVSAIEHRFRFKDGSWRVFESIGHYIHDFPSGPIGVINSRDITERLSLEAQFRQAQRLELLGRMTTTSAQAFSNVLDSIVSSAEGLLECELPLSAERRVWQLRRTAHQAQDWMQHVLLFSRHERVRPGDPVNVNDVVIRLTSLLRQLVGSERALTFTLSASSPWLELDDVLLEQVIVNLVANACDAMPSGGIVTITTSNRPAPDEASRHQIVISVGDTGAGMTDDVKAHIFDPFFGTKSGAGHSGLGLTTVFGIVDRAGGTVEIDTEAEAGTTVHVALPAHSSIDHDGTK
jgi:two-component system cell cycle sensor histidine kinase/response regulator CckA